MSHSLPVVTALPQPPDRHLFAGHEQSLAPFLVSLAEIANGVAEEPFGAITGGWWRSGDRPWDARVQEYAVVLVWFLTQRRPWNPYAADPALAARTSAALRRYLDLQHPGGAWPEYGPAQHSRSATGFALEALGSSLRMLVEAGALPDLHAPIAAAVRRAIDWYTDPANTEIWWPGFTPIVNQPTGALAGALECLDVLTGSGPAGTVPGGTVPAGTVPTDPGDDARREAVLDRLAVLAATGQSEAGYFHEPTGNDLPYTLFTMLPALAEIARHTDATAFAGPLDRYLDWLGRNAVLEPDGGTYVLNAAACARTLRRLVPLAPDPTRLWARTAALTALAPRLAAYLPTAAAHERIQADWAEDPAPVPGLPRPSSIRILSDATPGAYPDEATRAGAQRALPYLGPEPWSSLRTGADHDLHLHLRRAGYYLCAALGRRPTDVVRTGPGLLWHPRLGTVIAGDNGLGDGVWTYVHADGRQVADDDAFAQFFDGPAPNGTLRAVPADTGAVGLRVHDGANRHQVDWYFDETTLTSTAHANGPLALQVPLVVHDGDELRTGPRSVRLRRPGIGALTIEVAAGTGPTLTPTAWDGTGARRALARFTDVQGPVGYGFDDRDALTPATRRPSDDQA